jgi:hypothetical protein
MESMLNNLKQRLLVIRFLLAQFRNPYPEAEHSRDILEVNETWERFEAYWSNYWTIWIVITETRCYQRYCKFICSKK